MIKCIFAFLLILAVGPSDARSQARVDEEGVRRAVLDYVEGFYEGDDVKIRRGVSPDVNKQGFYKPRGSAENAYVLEPMSFDEMLAYTASVRESGRFAPENAVKKVQIFDVLDQTASAKLTAMWGVDYLLLGRAEGEWKILQVLWQTPPPPTSSR